MKVFGKEITEEQAKYLLKISQVPYIKGHRMFFDWNSDFISQFEHLFDKQGYTYLEEELNTIDVEDAVYRILDMGNPKAAFYAAMVLRGSYLHNKYFENVIIRRKDYESQIAYLANFNTARAQEIANCIAESGMSHYNLTLLINCPNPGDISKNVDVILKNGTIRQKVFLAKYVKNMGIEEIRQEVLESKDPRANYLFAKYIANRFISINGNPNSAYPESEINYITDFYSQFKQSTRDIMIAQHRKVIRDTKNVEYCYKLALNDNIDVKTGRRMSDDFLEIEDIVLNSCDSDYIAKFAVQIKEANTEKHLERLEQLGDIEAVEYVEQSLAMRGFFDKN